jgi:hypothetical protein
MMVRVERVSVGRAGGCRVAMWCGEVGCGMGMAAQEVRVVQGRVRDDERQQLHQLLSWERNLRMPRATNTQLGCAEVWADGPGGREY